MDWVHCNSCFFQPGQEPKRSFVLTSCGHIFCQCCERSGTIEKCKMCGVKCTTTPLSAHMTNEVQVYFEDPETVQDKLLKVMEFQKCHRQRLNENYRKVSNKYQNLKLAYQRMEEELKITKNELDMYKRNQEMSMMTPPQPKQQSLPLFSKNSQASKVIRSGLSRPGTPASPIFATPTGPGYPTSQQYRNQRFVTPSPSSDASNSPASVCSSLRGSQYRLSGLTSSQQQGYKPGFTPPISSLGMLSVNPQRSRNGTRY